MLKRIDARFLIAGFDPALEETKQMQNMREIAWSKMQGVSVATKRRSNIILDSYVLEKADDQKFELNKGVSPHLIQIFDHRPSQVRT